MRVLHVSDVHVTVALTDLPWRDMVNKRLLGALNYKLRRFKQFQHAAKKLAALAEFAKKQHVDLVICTGDYTALGTEPEFVAARAAISGLAAIGSGYLTVPGNHDIYLNDSLADRRFERHFGAFLKSDAVPGAATDGPWPIARLISDEVAVVAVNSARPNPQVWRSSGRIPERQLEALKDLLAAPEIASRFVFVITHYAPRRPDGTPDTWTHGLENADAFLDVCKALKRGAILHGHIHHRFRLAVPSLTAEIFGAGSSTCEHREGLWLFDVTRDGLTAAPGRYTNGEYVV
ncbi:MAG TPA: metallophosphoesterase [Polyangiales bacterium]|nr:metallophosphoesterase [Polyangiales bacterium]